MQNSSHEFRESMALIFQKSHIGFTCDTDMHAFGPLGIWRFTLWILTVSKVLMIPQQFISEKKCIVSSPFLCKIKIKEKLILCSMTFANQSEWLILWRSVYVVCVSTALSFLKWICLGLFIRVHIYTKRWDLCSV